MPYSRPMRSIHDGSDSSSSGLGQIGHSRSMALNRHRPQAFTDPLNASGVNLLAAITDRDLRRATDQPSYSTRNALTLLNERMNHLGFAKRRGLAQG
jgi:hypothetical protein